MSKGTRKPLRRAFRQGFTLGVISQLTAAVVVAIIAVSIGLGVWSWRGYAAAYLVGGFTFTYLVHNRYSSIRLLIGPLVGSFVLFVGTLLWLPIINLLMIPLVIIAILSIIFSCSERRSGLMVSGIVTIGALFVVFSTFVAILIGSMYLPEDIALNFDTILAGGSGPFFITLLSRTFPMTAPLITGIYFAGLNLGQEVDT